MGLIRAALSSAGTVLADQWKEYFTTDALSNDVLIAKGTKVTSGNNNGSEDIISNGSVIAVNEGQVALIVEDGKIVEFCAEAGRFQWDSSTEPSCFTGGFWKGIGESFKTFGKRFTFGGDTGKVQRVYFVNVKEIIGNKFGTSTPMVYDDPYYKTALYLRYFGQYSFKIADPIIFYTTIAGNVTTTYTNAQLQQTCSEEFMTALDTALSMCSGEGFKFSQLPQKQRELAGFMSTTLDDEWRQRRGMEIVSVALTKVTPDDKSRERIETFDTNVMHADPSAMAGGMAYAQMQAMQNAASNDAGAMTGFMGFGMAANAMGGAGAQGALLENANAIAAQKKAEAAPKAPTAPAEPAADTWTCACGKVNSGKFCQECGAKKPADGYTCKCGYKSDAPFRFCPECGAKQE